MGSDIGHDRGGHQPNLTKMVKLLVNHIGYMVEKTTSDEPTAHYCEPAGREVIGLGGRDRCPFCWEKAEVLKDQ